MAGNGKIRNIGRLRPPFFIEEKGTVKGVEKYIVYWSEEDKCYLAEVPWLPGCMADGKTTEEALQAVRVIADEWMETAAGIDRTIPKLL